MRLLASLAALLLLALGAADADEPSLALTLDGTTNRFTASELLARPDAAEITIPDDVAYGRAAIYRAVPLLALLSGLPANDQSDTLEARATDGFVAQIPLSLVRKGAAGGATAWVAVEPPGHPWPNLPGKTSGAGPFYLVWEHPERSGVTTEQWPYQLAGLTTVESPAHRWPQLAVDPSLPADSPARRGQAVFVANCLPCHRLNGGGAGEMGPDLGRPMNATHYLTDAGLRALVRDPKSVRTWPLQQMPGFGPDVVSEADLDALIDYLHDIAQRH
ncbi:MAG: cytochrome c [Acetobacteraceae bacterium]|nr:cytochrome c [Acetobacteraceae bacterium]